MQGAIYDTIGTGYSATRRPDPRIAGQIAAVLGDCRSVLNVGAGSGSYEPADRRVVALEPSATMIAQRSVTAAPAVQGVAGALPFRSGSFDAAMAVLTLHHWPDWRAGMLELARVARRRIAVLTCDIAAAHAFWLDEYIPEIFDLDEPRFPTLEQLGEVVGWSFEGAPVPVPNDCIDGFLGAWWARPEAYLDPDLRRGISSFSQLPREVVDRGLNQFRADLESGAWDARFGHLRRQAETDLGYRLLVCHR